MADIFFTPGSSLPEAEFEFGDIAYLHEPGLLAIGKPTIGQAAIIDIKQGSKTLQYNPQGQLIGVTNSYETKSLEYNSKGQLVKISGIGYEKNLSYDAQENLVVIQVIK